MAREGAALPRGVDQRIRRQTSAPERQREPCACDGGEALGARGQSCRRAGMLELKSTLRSVQVQVHPYRGDNISAIMVAFIVAGVWLLGVQHN